MAEEPSDADVVGHLVARLEAGATLVDAGGFTLDPTRMRERFAA